MSANACCVLGELHQMTRLCITLCAGIAALSLSTAALDLPLEYRSNPRHQEMSLKVTNIRFSDQNPQGPGARPGTAGVSFESSGSLVGLRWIDQWSTLTRVAGRLCMSSGVTGMVLQAEPDLRALPRGNYYVAVEYLDEVSTQGNNLKLYYRAAGEESRPGGTWIDGPKMQGTNQWKTHTFVLKDFAFGPQPKQQRNAPGYDLYLCARPEHMFMAYDSKALALSLDRPFGSFRWPNANTPQPLYGETVLARTRRVLCIGKARPEDEFFTRLWFDANANGDFTDERPVDAPLLKIPDMPDYHSAEFSPISFECTTGGKTLKYEFSVTCRFNGPTRQFLKADLDTARMAGYMQTGCYYATKFAQNGRTYRMALVDQDCDGIIGEANKDSLFMTVDRELNYNDGYMLPSNLLVGANLFSLRADTPNARLSLMPYTGPTGTLEVPAAPLSTA